MLTAAHHFDLTPNCSLSPRGARLFFVSMCVAAVYLDHHWVIDVLLGIVYTLVVELTLRRTWVRAEA